MSMRFPFRVPLWVMLAGLFAATAASSQTTTAAPPAKTVMHQKLARSQAILGAVVTSDWPTLGRESRALLALTRDPQFVALVTPETRQRTEPFAISLQELVDAADRKDLSDAVMAQVSMNLHCVRCHQLMARLSQRQPK